MPIPVVVGAAAAIAARLAAKKAAQEVAKKATKKAAEKIAKNSVKVKPANSQGIPNSVFNKIQTSSKPKYKSGENAKNRAREDASEIAYLKMMNKEKTKVVKIKEKTTAPTTKAETKANARALKAANKPVSKNNAGQNGSKLKSDILKNAQPARANRDRGGSLSTLRRQGRTSK